MIMFVKFCWFVLISSFFIISGLPDPDVVKCKNGFCAVAPGDKFTTKIICSEKNITNSTSIPEGLLVTIDDTTKVTELIGKLSRTTFKNLTRLQGELNCSLIRDQTFMNGFNFSCQRANGSWKTTDLKLSSLPMNRSISFALKCFPSSKAKVISVDVGLKPEEPSHFTCATYNYQEMHCKWSKESKPTMGQHIVSEKQTRYKVFFYKQANNYDKNNFGEKYSMSNYSEKTCHSTLKKEKKDFFIDTFNVTVIAKNAVGSKQTSLINCDPPVYLEMLKNLKLRSVLSNNNSVVDLVLQWEPINNTAIHKRKNMLMNIELFQVNKSAPTINELMKNKPETKVVKECGWFMNPFDELPSIFQKKQKRQTNVTFTKLIEEKVVFRNVSSNATVIVRARNKISDKYRTTCGENKWNQFVFSNALRTKLVKPKSIKMEFLWFRDVTNCLSPPDERRLVIWPRVDAEIDFYLWTSNCSRRSLPCVFTMQASRRNLLSTKSVLYVKETGANPNYNGFSKNFILKANLTVGLKNEALIQFETYFSSSLQLPFQEKNASLVVFFWKINQQINETEYENIESYFTFHNSSKNDFSTRKANISGSLLNETSAFLTTPDGELVIVQSSIQTFMTDIEKLNNKVYQSKFTQDFIEGAVYKFAVALKENNGLSHAFLIPNGYTFSIAAPSGAPKLKDAFTSTTSLTVEWKPVDLQQQRGQILNYNIYLTKNEKCLKRECAEAIHKYFVYSELHDDRVWTEKDMSQLQTITYKKTINDLEPNNWYYVTVSAENSDGEGPTSGPRSLTLKNEEPKSSFQYFGVSITGGIGMFVLWLGYLFRKRLCPALAKIYIHTEVFQAITSFIRKPKSAFIPEKRQAEIVTPLKLKRPCTETVAVLTEKEPVSSSLDRIDSKSDQIDIKSLENIDLSNQKEEEPISPSLDQIDSKSDQIEIESPDNAASVDNIPAIEDYQTTRSRSNSEGCYQDVETALLGTSLILTSNESNELSCSDIQLLDSAESDSFEENSDGYVSYEDTSKVLSMQERKISFLIEKEDDLFQID